MRAIFYIENNKTVTRIQLPEDRGNCTRDIELKMKDTVEQMMAVLRQNGFECTDININITGYNSKLDKIAHLDL